MKAALFTLMPLLSSRLSKFSWAAINPSHLTHPPPPPEKHIRPGAVRVCGSETIRRGVGRAGCFCPPEGEGRALWWDPPPRFALNRIQTFPTEQEEDIFQHVAVPERQPGNQYKWLQFREMKESRWTRGR